MPRKVNAINLEQKEEQPEDITVEFDTFTKIKNEVENEPVEDANDHVEPTPAPKKRAVRKKATTDEPLKVVEPKKRTTKKNNIVVEEVKPVEEVRHPFLQNLIDNYKKEEHQQAIEEEKPKNIKTLELVNCDKCGKQMTKKTLRYHHDKNCPGEKIDKEALPVKKRSVKKESENIPKEVIEVEVNKRIENTFKDRLNERMKVKQEKIKKLATQIA